MRELPTGANRNGSDSTDVRRSDGGVSTAHRGRKVMASNARQFSRRVISASAPPSM